MATLLWRGLGEFRAELAYARVERDGLRARGAQIGAYPEAYALDYLLEPDRLEVSVVAGASAEFRLDGCEAFDLGYSPLFNSIPVIRDRLHAGGEARDYVMAWVSVPDLAVERSEQRYEPLDDGRVRFRAGSFAADLALDREGFVVRYPGLAERVI